MLQNQLPLILLCYNLLKKEAMGDKYDGGWTSVSAYLLVCIWQQQIDNEHLDLNSPRDKLVINSSTLLYIRTQHRGLSMSTKPQLAPPAVFVN